MTFIDTMTLQLTTNGTSDLTTIISAISSLVEEAVVTATPEGLHFRGMDASHVALMEISWRKDAFKEYLCSEDVRFGFRLDEISKIVKRLGKNDDVVLTLLEDRMIVKIADKKEFELRLLNIDFKDTPIPTIRFDAKFTITPATLDGIVGDISILSDFLSITATSSECKFFGSGDSGKSTVIATLNNGMLKELTSETEQTSSYSLEYIKPVVKPIGQTLDTIDCEFSTNKPLKMLFPLSSGYVIFFLAPKVQS